MIIENITIIGVGLIGGSFALAVKEQQLTKNIIGVDTSEMNIEKALALGLIDEALSLEDAVKKSDFIFLAIPVDATVTVVEKLMEFVTANHVIADAGSTKLALCNMLKDHPLRSRFVATHPMWGTEHSGPEAAINGAFAGKACVICDKENSAQDALETMEFIYKKIGMHLVYMDAQAHDLHAAYVSHISHITSFALANTVLEKEREDDAIFELASGGFESTVRLAKSNAAMWVPIFKQNKENILDVLNEHIMQLKKFKSCLEKENYNYLQELIEDANKISRIIK
jgi:prephenate dehydrogenase